MRFALLVLSVLTVASAKSTFDFLEHSIPITRGGSPTPPNKRGSRSRSRNKNGKSTRLPPPPLPPASIPNFDEEQTSGIHRRPPTPPPLVTDNTGIFSFLTDFLKPPQQPAPSVADEAPPAEPVDVPDKFFSNLPIPGVKFSLNPLTTLKLRKIFKPLGTTLTVGAEYTTQLGVWQYRCDWEDRIIGGRLTVKGKELQVSRTWILSLGAVEDVVTRLRLRGAVDMQTGKCYAKFGFRSERLSPINLVEGFVYNKRFPLDGKGGHAEVELKLNFAFPEPDIEFSTERVIGRKHIVGMGDIEIGAEELNLVMTY